MQVCNICKREIDEENIEDMKSQQELLALKDDKCRFYLTNTNPVRVCHVCRDKIGRIMTLTLHDTLDKIQNGGVNDERD